MKVTLEILMGSDDMFDYSLSPIFSKTIKISDKYLANLIRADIGIGSPKFIGKELEVVRRAANKKFGDSFNRIVKAVKLHNPSAIMNYTKYDKDMPALIELACHIKLNKDRQFIIRVNFEDSWTWIEYNTKGRYFSYVKSEYLSTDNLATFDQKENFAAIWDNQKFTALVLSADGNYEYELN